jgi:hypothetical protein
MVWPVAVNRVDVVILAMPKSITVAVPSSSRTSTFDGFMSRWTTPRPCAYSRPRSTSTAIRVAVGQSWPSLSMISRSQVWPCTNCMARTKLPFSCPKL